MIISMKKSNLRKKVNLIILAFHFLDCLIALGRWYFRISRSGRKKKEKKRDRTIVFVIHAVFSALLSHPEARLSS